MQAQIYDILRPKLAMNRFLHLWPHRFPHFGYINLGEGAWGGSDNRSMSSIRPICKCRCPPLLYTRIQCEGGRGVWGTGPQTDKHLPQNPLTDLFMLENFRKTFPHEIRVKNSYTGNHRILYLIYVHNYLSFLIRLSALTPAANSLYR